VPETEFHRQVDTLLRRGYPGLAALKEAAFLDLVMPLEATLDAAFAAMAPIEAGGAIPFVLVVPSTFVPTEAALPLVSLGDRPGFTEMTDLARFQPVDGIEIPAGSVYLATDVDTGADTLNMTPDDAMPTILARGRSPLTIDEGVALVTHRPEVLRTHNCFSILGSRCGDRRVPALWISRKHPRLGWCWAGNPHTWLGSASCGGRAGA
jgi:hypothetical protein